MYRLPRLILGGRQIVSGAQDQESMVRATFRLNNIIKNRSLSCSIISNPICSFSACSNMRHDLSSISENFGINYCPYFLCQEGKVVLLTLIIYSQSTSLSSQLLVECLRSTECIFLTFSLYTPETLKF